MRRDARRGYGEVEVGGGSNVALGGSETDVGAQLGMAERFLKERDWCIVTLRTNGESGNCCHFACESLVNSLPIASRSKAGFICVGEDTNIDLSPPKGVFISESDVLFSFGVSILP